MIQLSSKVHFVYFGTTFSLTGQENMNKIRFQFDFNSAVKIICPITVNDSSLANDNPRTQY